MKIASKTPQKAQKTAPTLSIHNGEVDDIWNLHAQGNHPRL